MNIEHRLLVKNCIEKIHSIEELSRLFYKALFHLDIQLESIFPGNVTFLNRKFINMMATFKNVKHLESINESVAKMGERHALRYGAEIKHFPVLRQALDIALAEYLKSEYTPELQHAWQLVFDEVSAIMTQAISNLEHDNNFVEHHHDNYDAGLLADIGGESIVFNVHQRFYDEIFEEPWLEKFFFGKSKEVLIEKQTKFMAAAFGGENNYTGDTPAFIHMHMLITEEMLKVRERILRSAILAEGLSEEITERWLKVDRAFWAAIIKNSEQDCVLKCRGQMPIIAKKPIGYQVVF